MKDIKEILRQIPQTPMKANQYSELELDAKLAVIENHFREIMLVLGLDLEDDSLQDTPKRVAKMYLKEIFYGLDESKFPKITVVENKMGSQMVTESNITVNSTCEHHFITIVGKAHISYIPKGKVLGLSKFNRIVEFFSARPQVQERLTEQVQKCLQLLLETDDVAVVFDAVHFCVRARGVKDESSFTRTSALGGVFKNDPNSRSEFFNTIPKADSFKL
jgi:GTP cyclohydrolase I